MRVQGVQLVISSIGGAILPPFSRFAQSLTEALRGQRPTTSALQYLVKILH